MSKKHLNVIAFICGLFFSACFSIYAQEEKKYGRSMLIQNVRQLAQIVESAHPDPYIRGGGKIAFLRRLQKALGSIPQVGMTAEEFYKHLLPFIAALGDGHPQKKKRNERIVPLNT